MNISASRGSNILWNRFNTKDVDQIPVGSFHISCILNIRTRPYIFILSSVSALEEAEI